MAEEKQIIELECGECDNAEIRYFHPSARRRMNQPPSLVRNVLGLLLFLGFLAFALVFFVYVIIPVVIVSALWIFSKRTLQRFSR